MPDPCGGHDCSQTAIHLRNLGSGRHDAALLHWTAMPAAQRWLPWLTLAAACSRDPDPSPPASACHRETLAALAKALPAADSRTIRDTVVKAD